MKAKSYDFLALGDSYTICEGVDFKDSWSFLLKKHYFNEGINLNLIKTPAQTGFTTFDFIEKEIPILLSKSSQFASVLIGVNDWVQEINEDIFRHNFKKIIHIVKENCENTLVLNIPDFSLSSKAHQYAKERNISKGLAQFNEIIKEESILQNLEVVDIYTLSQKLGSDLKWFAPDGLHPSAKAYKRWASEIQPFTDRIFKV